MLTYLSKLASYAFVGLVAISSLVACAQGRANQGVAPVRDVTVCSLYGHGEQMSGNLVRLSGIYTTDRMENTTITDPHCSKVWILPYDAISNVDRDNLKRFDDAVAGKLSDSSLRVFAVTLLGKFVWRQNKNPHGAFYIQKVTQFKRLHNVNPWKQRSGE
jgi:hypothetical protein